MCLLRQANSDVYHNNRLIQSYDHAVGLSVGPSDTLVHRVEMAQLSNRLIVTSTFLTAVITSRKLYVIRTYYYHRAEY